MDERPVVAVTAELVTLSHPALPAPVLALGEPAARRFAEFFTAHIANDNTRAAYAQAIRRLCDWCEHRPIRIALPDLDPIGAAAYLEQAKTELSLESRKLHRSALNGLFDFWVTGGVLPANPFASVRLPRSSQRSGKTPVLFEGEVRALFAAIPTDTLIGLRDRALIGCMFFGFLRVSAVTKLQLKHYEAGERRATLAVLEKGGKWQRIPCHHLLTEAIDAYLAAMQAAGAPQDRNGPLFCRGRGRSHRLATEPLTRAGVFYIIKQYARAAGLPHNISPHSLRAAAITIYLANGGDLETAAALANHASPRTTQLYNRNPERLTQAEVERLRF